MGDRKKGSACKGRSNFQEFPFGGQRNLE